MTQMNGQVLHGRCNTDILSQHYSARSPALNMIHTQSINPPPALYQLPVTTSFPHALSALNVSAVCSRSEVLQVQIIISLVHDACCWAAVVCLKQRVNGHRLYIVLKCWRLLFCCCKSLAVQIKPFRIVREIIYAIPWFCRCKNSIL